MRIPYLSSNLPSKIFDAYFWADKRKSFRAISVFKPFCELLLHRMVNQGAKIRFFKHFLNKTYANKYETFLKFVDTSESFVIFILV